MRNTLHACYLAIGTRDAPTFDTPSSPKSQDILAVAYLPPALPRGRLFTCVRTPLVLTNCTHCKQNLATAFLSYTSTVPMQVKASACSKGQGRRSHGAVSAKRRGQHELMGDATCAEGKKLRCGMRQADSMRSMKTGGIILIFQSACK